MEQLDIVAGRTVGRLEHTGKLAPGRFSVGQAEHMSMISELEQCSDRSS